MDILTILLVIGIIVSAAGFIIGGMFAGAMGAAILGTLVLVGFATIPTTPFIPLWVVIFIIIIEAVLLAYKIAEAMGIRFNGGNTG